MHHTSQTTGNLQPNGTGGMLNLPLSLVLLKTQCELESCLTLHIFLMIAVMPMTSVTTYMLTVG